MTKNRIIIAGGRDFRNYDWLSENLAQAVSELEGTVEIVSGTARGADRLGERWATEQHIPIKRFPAQWDLYGKSAGYKRNTQMVKYATHLIAFWNGESRGTQHMIDTARAQGLQVVVVRY